MARRITVSGGPSEYNQRERFTKLFAASLSHPTPPSVVAQKILEVAESGSWQLRYPAGPDAVPLLEWRKQMTDEEWVDLSAGDYETFFGHLQRSMTPKG